MFNIEEDDVGRACTKCVRTKRINARFWWENQKERHQQNDLDLGGRIIFKAILENRME
jgi:hypothetical protein